MSAAKRKKTEIRDTIENRDRIHMVMVLLTVLFIAFSVGILVCIGHIQATYNVNPKVINLFRPRADKYVEHPKRGKILAEDGRPLAITTPLYDIYMDCTVRKSEFVEMDVKEARRIQRLKDKGKEAPERYALPSARPHLPEQDRRAVLYRNHRRTRQRQEARPHPQERQPRHPQ